MFKNVKISWKITLRLLIVVLLSVTAISYLSYNQSKELIQKRYTESFKLVSSLKSQQIDGIFSKVEDNLREMSQDPSVQDAVRFLDDWDPELSPFVFDSVGSVLDTFFQPKGNLYEYEDIVIANTSERTIYSLNRAIAPNVGERDLNFGELFTDLKDSIANSSGEIGIIFGKPRKIEGKNVTVLISYPIYLGVDPNPKGLLIARMSLTKQIYPIVEDSTGIGSEGEIVLGNLSKTKGSVNLISPLKHSNSGVTDESILVGEDTRKMYGLQDAAFGGKNDYGFDKDYRGKEVLAYWRYIPTPKWGMVVMIPKEKIYADLDELRVQFFVFGVIILAISAFASYFVLTLLTNPIAIIRDRLKMVAQGILPENVVKETNDEIGEMALAVKDLVSALQRTAHFAKQIGEGDYDAKFTPMSQQDTLGNALLSMRDSIQEAEKKDSERNWIVSGIAEVSQILRFRNNLEELGDDVLSFVTGKIQAIQGAFYTIEREEGEEPVIVMQASYAYNKKKYLKSSFKFSEGLVGQCALEKDIILRLEIPDDYMTISSGLIGDQKPKSLLFVPLITNDEQVYGILEFAGFELFSDTQIKFVKEISVIIARTIFNIKVNERTEHMLQESQQLGEELKYQQEILRQNAEEMEATQEQLKRTNTRLEEQIQEVNNTQKRLQLLLKNASEVITIYEKDGTIRYVSPSVEPILGYTPDEMQDSNIAEFLHSESLVEFKSMFEQVVNAPDEGVTIQYQYQKKNGDVIWVESRGANFLSDHAIQGILVNTRDITERRRAEKEQRMRSQMQALSENSPDLIVRVNSEGRFFYINPVIRKLTGRKKEYFLSRTLFDVKLSPDILSVWQNAFQKVIETKAKFDFEMDFPSVEGDRIMQVNAIPEFNDRTEVESVLFVVHDITESKQIEREIRSNNLKITESINYAKRIQRAILPSYEQIRKVLPDSFLYYKPRDVVSGDFPWFIQKNGYIYVAAVDCTGHGVPGALISLIGYFILNDILNTQNQTDVGAILDSLHAGVTKTLRQEGNSQTRDGMDIALAKINLEKKEVSYAGAHRPLLYFSKNGLEQIKGDRFPIGGGEYKIREPFKTHHIKVESGDEIYLFSDGLTDQFGGVNNRKFTIKRLREVILERKHENMDGFRQIISDRFDEWKGEYKQTDDVIMIGVKF